MTLLAHLENRFPLYDSSDWATENLLKKSGGGDGNLTIVIDSEEHLIGKWFGKDLFCKAYHIEKNSLNNKPVNTSIFVGNLDPNYTICMMSCVNIKTDRYVTPIPIEYYTNNGQGAYYSINSQGDIELKCYSDSQKNGEFWFVLFYFK